MMGAWWRLSCAFVVIFLHISSAQLPPRPLSIPGAVLVQGARPVPFRTPRINADFAPQRPRRPQASPIPAPLREVRPVVEEEEEEPVSPPSNFDADVNKLGISALASAVRQASSDDLEEPTLRPSALPFRPERPIPITRDQIRDRPIDALPRPIPRPQPVPRPLPGPVPRPILRQERPIARQEVDDEEDLPIRQPTRKVRPQAPPQQVRPAPPPRPSRPEYNGDGSGKRTEPVQILRKYRTDNPDGSITWGFENEDGTFKEETLGNDCRTTGKYGYIDPDGVRREYSYEAGRKCDQQEEEPLEEEEPLPRIQHKKPLNNGKQQQQFRPPAPGQQY